MLDPIKKLCYAVAKRHAYYIHTHKFRINLLGLNWFSSYGIIWLLASLDFLPFAYTALRYGARHEQSMSAHCKNIFDVKFLRIYSDCAIYLNQFMNYINCTVWRTYIRKILSNVCFDSIDRLNTMNKSPIFKCYFWIIVFIGAICLGTRLKEGL